MTKNIIIFVGPPLSGKGTQGKILSKSLNIGCLSTGELFRKVVQSGSSEGQKMEQYMNSGLLIPNEMTCDMLKTELLNKEYKNGFILDGFPRELDNIKILDSIVETLHNEKAEKYEILCVINMKICNNELFERLKRRQNVEKRLRHDNNVLEKRLEIFESLTVPVIDYYRKTDILININADDTVENIAKHIHCAVMNKKRFGNIRKYVYATDDVHDEIESKLSKHGIETLLSYSSVDFDFKNGSENDKNLLAVFFTKNGKLFVNERRKNHETTIDEYILKRLYFKEPEKHIKQNKTVKRPIDFNFDIFEYINSHKYFSYDSFKNSNLHNLMINVVNNGIFFKNSSNKRMKNYWNTTFNGGLPIVKKSDEVHEATFMFHDFCHFAMPDLIFTGNKSERHRVTYIFWRMASEAISIILADMMFVDVIKNVCEQDYDFSKRKIYPLFCNIKKNTKLKTILYANSQYCFFGDDNELRNILNDQDSHVLEEYKKKYETFFVQDFKWTDANYANMEKRSNAFKLWFNDVKNIIPKNLQTIDEIVDMFIDKDLKHLPHFIFDYVCDSLFNNFLLKKPENISTHKRDAFVKYMIGQLMIFFSQPECNAHETKNKILSILKEENFGTNEMNMCRTLYENFLEELFDKKNKKITLDDLYTYKETYPMFDEMYLTYDLKIDETIESITKGILNFCKDSNKCKENKYQKIMKIMLGDKNNYHDIFVYRPNVVMLSHIGLEIPQNQVTFLIAGITVETSMELCAHNEASVARLTSSKTKAMDEPMYKILSNCDTHDQKIFINKMIEMRTKNDFSREQKNIMNIGNKVTALTYTMTIENLHKLFIGRSKENGNETELREVIKLMVDQSHQLFPNLIKTWKEYLTMNNSCKHTKNNKIVEIPCDTCVTKLTNPCKLLFEKLGINNELPEYLQMSEFRSRITYFSFVDKILTYDETIKYLKNVIFDNCHMSVTNAFQLICVKNIGIEDINFKTLFQESCKSKKYDLFVY
jgi:adenylate kinase